MNNLLIGLKREYWEYRRVIIGVPAVLSILILLAAVMATIYANKLHQWSLEQANQDATELSIEGAPQLKSDPQLEDESEINEATSAHQHNVEWSGADKNAKEFVSLFLGVAWLVGCYYLLSALYIDRKDGSVLYWKSMPVSETRNVLTKLVFGSLAFVLVALIAAWLTYPLLDVFNLGAPAPKDGETWGAAERDFDAFELFVWPLHGIAGGLLLGAPVFAYLLLISAVAKRSRILLLVGPLIIARVLEGIFFRTNHIIGFFSSHTPFGILDKMNDSDTISVFWQSLFQPSLWQGLVTAVLFLFATIWWRNNRFES